MIAASHHRNYLRSIFGGICIGLGFTFTYILGISTVLLAIDRENVDRLETNYTYSLLDEVQRIVNHVYLREVPEKTAIEYGLISGYLETLNDPATFFIEPPVASSESQGLAGTYGGIGVQIRLSEDGRFLIYPYEDSPASDAGVKANDVLIEINNERLEPSMNTDVVQQKLRGEVTDSNGVNILFVSGEDLSKEVYIPFAVVNVPSVVSRIVSEDSSIGYIEIIRFTSRTPQELDDQLNVLLAANISSLILDLRDNSGGLLNESIQVADKFLSTGDIIVREESRDGINITNASDDPSDALNIPIVVLVNQRTASASEIVAGALQDNGRAILIGQGTFGKGTVQQIFPLQDGSSIHVTSAEWFTPSNSRIQDTGLVPDIEMIPDVNGREVEFAEAIRYLQTLVTKQSR